MYIYIESSPNDRMIKAIFRFVIHSNSARFDVCQDITVGFEGEF